MSYSYCDVDNAYNNQIQKQINNFEATFADHKKHLFKNLNNFIKKLFKYEIRSFFIN